MILASTQHKIKMIFAWIRQKGNLQTNFQPLIQYTVRIRGLTFKVRYMSQRRSIFRLLPFVGELILAHTESPRKYLNIEYLGQF